jgi:hypothetical protein
MAKKTEQEISRRVQELESNFQKYITIFNEHNPFSGPSEYLYTKKIIDMVKKANEESEYKELFQRNFIEWVYATLCSWGMHRMGPKDKGPKMSNYEKFEECIISNKDNFVRFHGIYIKDVDLSDKQFFEDLKRLYLNLRNLMDSGSKLVSTTKVMHFFLPELIPPMDREYTMKFFKKYLPTNKNIDDELKEYQIFEDTFRIFVDISKKVNCSIDQQFCPSLAKGLDNSIIGYIISHNNIFKKDKKIVLGDGY